MSLEDQESYKRYLQAEFAGVRLEFANTQNFDIVDAARMIMRLEDKRNQACLEAEHDENCLQALGNTTFEASADARIILGTETVTPAWDSPITGYDEGLSGVERTSLGARVRRIGSTMIGNPGSFNIQVAASEGYPMIAWRLPI